MPKGTKNQRAPKMSKEDRVKQQIKRMIEKTDKVRSRRQAEANFLTLQQNQLQDLLSKADNLDANALKDELRNIARSAKNKNQCMKAQRKEEMRAFKDQKRKAKWAMKEQKNQRKQEKRKFKMQRKQGKIQRKQAKEMKKLKLESSRLDALPASQNDINAQNVLYIHIDGYNIIGCDSICRKAMRNRGANKARKRLAVDLVQKQFLDAVKTGNIQLDYNVVITIHFDGNGRNEKISDDIEIVFSTKKQIVDDKLVEMFGKTNDKKDNGNILVITSDRELTLRLDNIGVKVMKSSTFYKKYLKQEEENNGNNDDDNTNNDDVKDNANDDDNAPDFGDDIDDDLAALFAAKMKTNSDHDGEESPDNDNNDNDDNNVNYPLEETSVDGENDDNYTFDDVYDEVMNEVDDD